MEQVLGGADGSYRGFSLSGGQNSWTGPRETGTGTGWGTGLSLWVLLKHPGYPQIEAILIWGSSLGCQFSDMAARPPSGRHFPTLERQSLLLGFLLITLFPFSRSPPGESIPSLTKKSF